MRRAASCLASALGSPVKQFVTSGCAVRRSFLPISRNELCVFVFQKWRTRRARPALLVRLRKTGTMASETTTPALEALVVALHDIGAVKVPAPPPPLCGRAGCRAPILGCVCMPASNRATRLRALRASRLASAAHAPSWTHVSGATI